MTYWILPSNEEKFRLSDLLKETNLVDWRQHNYFNVGDIAFMYNSRPDHRILYKMVVERINVSSSEYINDKKFWVDADGMNEGFELNKFVRLRLIKSAPDSAGLSLDDLRKHGLKGNIQSPRIIYQSIEKELLDYILGEFEKKDSPQVNTSHRHMGESDIISNLQARPMIVVDLNNGSYLETRIGHEYYNFKRNEFDGRYYGYCPPYDNIDTTKLGATKGNPANNVVVIYVTKKKDSNNRIVIGFTDKATILPERKYDKRLNRLVYDSIKKMDVHCSYSIISDSIYDLRSEKNPFEIQTSEYNPWMFRMQRFYGGTYPDLDQKLITYIASFLNEGLDEDDSDFQQSIQDEDVSIKDIESDTSLHPIKYSNCNGTKSIERNSRYSKMALVKAEYRCSFNSKHDTFKTPKGVPYMEGHHLIPCTASNSEHIWERFHRNIDCVENIVCLCPTCHRRIHFGSMDEKKEIIEKLYINVNKELSKVGIKISLDELMALYQ